MSFKNIKVPVGKTGKTRLQRVQVLKSGKFKFVKNLKKGSGSTKKQAKRSSSKRTGKVRNTAKGKMFRTLSGVGALEDVGIGFIGFTLLGKTPAALPMTRAIQGIAAIAMDRRGKNRAVSGILDLITLWLAGGFGVRQRISAGAGTGFGGGGAGARVLMDLQNLAKIRPL